MQNYECVSWLGFEENQSGDTAVAATFEMYINVINTVREIYFCCAFHMRTRWSAPATLSGNR